MTKKINGHTIITRTGENTFYECGTCKSFVYGHRTAIYKSSRCRNCQLINKEKYIYKGRTLKQWCWILSLYYPTIKSRIKKSGRSIKEALFQDFKEVNESFNKNDLKYLSDFYNKTYEKDKQIAEKAKLKYKNIKI